MNKLTDTERTEALAELPDWTLQDKRDAIERSIKFKDFSAAWGFMNQRLQPRGHRIVDPRRRRPDHPGCRVGKENRCLPERRRRVNRAPTGTGPAADFLK
jgi:hypothetical protein